MQPEVYVLSGGYLSPEELSSFRVLGVFRKQKDAHARRDELIKKRTDTRESFEVRKFKVN